MFTRHISKIELVGCVGAVHKTIVGEQRNVRFSVAVSTDYGSVFKTTWFNCTYWGNCKIEKGDEIHLEGLMHGNTIEGVDGQPRTIYEVKVQKIW